MLTGLFQTRKASWYVQHFEWVLGTSLEFRVCTTGSGVKAERVLLTEIARLEAVLSRFLPSSELNTFLATQGQAVVVSTELWQVLEAALFWQQRSNHAFSCGAEVLMNLWRAAESLGIPPSSAQIAALLPQIQAPIVQLEANKAMHCSSLPINLHAIAKGFIAHAAAQKVLALTEVSEVLVNLGGDIQHLGQEPYKVGIANPFSSADNAPLLTTVQLCSQALATSGNTHRGFRFPNGWYSHVLDPRSGYPVQQVVSASVIAADAATADVLSTIFSVLELSQSLELANTLPNVGCCLVTANAVQTNDFWQHHQFN